MSKKKLKSAPPVTEETPEELDSDVQPSPATKEDQKATASPFPREEIEKAFNNPMLRGFKKYLDPIMNYLESVETRLQDADKNFGILGAYLKDRDAKLQPLISLSEQIQQRQQQTPTTAAPQGGLDLGALMPILQSVMGSGGNPLGDAITQKIVDAGLDSMFAGQRFLKAVQDKMLSNMGAKIVEDAIPK